MSDQRTRAELETELLERVCQTQAAWLAAPTDKDRLAARLRFMDALQAFNSLVLYGKGPGAS